MCTRIRGYVHPESGRVDDRCASITELYEYDTDTAAVVLKDTCGKCDFVFHFADVNRPKEPYAFMKQNCGAAVVILEELKAQKNACPVMFVSSAQKTITGRFAGSEYGKSKLAGEELFFRYAVDTEAVFRN